MQMHSKCIAKAKQMQCKCMFEARSAVIVIVVRLKYPFRSLGKRCKCIALAMQTYVLVINRYSGLRREPNPAASEAKRADREKWVQFRKVRRRM